MVLYALLHSAFNLKSLAERKTRLRNPLREVYYYKKKKVVQFSSRITLFLRTNNTLTLGYEKEHLIHYTTALLLDALQIIKDSGYKTTAM